MGRTPPHGHDRVRGLSEIARVLYSCLKIEALTLRLLYLSRTINTKINYCLYCFDDYMSYINVTLSCVKEDV